MMLPKNKGTGDNAKASCLLSLCPRCESQVAYRTPLRPLTRSRMEQKGEIETSLLSRSLKKNCKQQKKENLRVRSQKHTIRNRETRRLEMALQHVTAFVTGAASGLGQATALRFLKQVNLSCHFFFFFFFVMYVCMRRVILLD